ncbi:MAG: TatD family hydrolase [Minisyncoccia bacterium]
MTEYIDIHSHLSFEDYKQDLLGVLINMRANNVATIAVGSDYKSSAEAVELASQNPDVFACVGLHPDEDKAEIFDIKKYEELIQKQKVVAVGECGLDYFRLGDNPENQIKKQKEIFSAQIALAKKYNKPLMLHIRDAVNNLEYPKGRAFKDVLEMLKENNGVTGNVHFFAGTWLEAEQFLNLGFTLSFTGVITFARSYDEVIKKAPLNMIMAETDAPYVAPVPFRGKRNEPAYVTEVVKKIAEIRGEDVLWVKHQLVENAKRVFKLNI